MQPCTEDGCGSEAIFTYVWPWGDQGHCCARHQIVISQRSEALGRGTINFTALDPGRPQAITRDERTRLIAERMSTEQDLVEVKARSAELYQINTELQSEVRRLRARNTEIEAQVKDAREDLQKVIGERDEALADLHDAQTEVRRLQALLPRAPQPPQQPTQPASSPKSNP